MDGACRSPAGGWGAKRLPAVTVRSLQEGCLHPLDASEAVAECYPEAQIKMCQKRFERARWVTDMVKPGSEEGGVASRGEVLCYVGGGEGTNQGMFNCV